ncbi:hypothetical protein BC937DRAFT_87006 [Endogone sp. FLAS-F59071]|nr:hypothetical protein BC937DRAFT_87006 [Endogone sp. FLAS-F59071]|eukprot:RUS19743.1 hypothetical protein BC937DRAFT_87006 [Endogone sp. FLAS-F59071]
MNKRGADRQLTQLNVEDEDNIDSEDSGEFQKASEEILAKRAIKKPKSRLGKINGGGISAPTPFSAFGGFGTVPSLSAAAESKGEAQPAAPKPFAGFSFPQTSTFSTTTFGNTTDSTTTPAESAFSIKPAASTAPTIQPSNQGLSFPPPKTAEDAHSTRPLSAGFSFSSSGSTMPATEPPKQPNLAFLFAPPKATEETPNKATEETSDKPTPTAATSSLFTFSKAGDTKPTLASLAENKENASSGDLLEKRREEYYRHLRGLNVSLQRRINTDLQIDAFADLSDTLKQYTSYRQEILSKYDDVVKVGSAGSKISMTVPASAPGFTFNPAGYSFKPTTDSGKPNKVPTPTFTFGSIGGVSGSTPATVTKDVDDAPKPVFNFGVITSQASTTSSTPKLSFSFSAPSTTATTTATTSTAVGFGNPSTTSLFGGLNSGINTTTTSAFSTPFSFNLSASPFVPLAQKKDNDAGEGETKDDDDEPPAGEEGFSGARSNTELVQTGEGEENETSLIVQRCKVFKANSNGAWADNGVGILKLNENTVSKKKRFLCRAEGSGRILINANAFPNMKFKVDPQARTVMLVLPDETTNIVKYLIRVKTSQMAEDLATSLTKHTMAE